MAKQTVLYDEHVANGAKMVDFHGWMMPLHYGSQINEHNQVRTDAGMFDVSHMTIVDLNGEGCRSFLRYLLANDINKLTVKGKALYSPMLNASGGVIDDLIVYYLDDHYYRLVVNSATREKDITWINQHISSYPVRVTVRDDLALIAVQGPQAPQKVQSILSPHNAKLLPIYLLLMEYKPVNYLLLPLDILVKPVMKLHYLNNKLLSSGISYWERELNRRD